jgi:hypothetical protein
MKRTLPLLLFALSLLAACSSDGLDDLRDFVKSAQAEDRTAARDQAL